MEQEQARHTTSGSQESGEGVAETAARNVTRVIKSGRGPRLRQAELDRFLLRLAQTEDPALAADYAGRPAATFRKRRQRDPEFRRQWDAAVAQIQEKEEAFFEVLDRVGVPGVAAGMVGLSKTWYLNRIRRDEAFMERAWTAKVRHLGRLLELARDKAEIDAPTLRWLIERLGHGLM